MLEEPSSVFPALAGADPQLLDGIADGVEGKGQQVHGGEHHGVVLFAGPEIVFEVVAVVFQDIEGLVPSFPSGSGAVSDLGDTGFVDWKAGDEGALDITEGTSPLAVAPAMKS